MTKMDPLPPVHPGEVLREEYLAPLGITPYALAATLRLSRNHVERLVREETSLTRHTALRLAGYFGTSLEFWLSIQDRFDEHATRRAAPWPKRSPPADLSRTSLVPYVLGSERSPQPSDQHQGTVSVVFTCSE
jgi:addiction module HigA family antidote